jgi:hypothetical protein
MNTKTKTIAPKIPWKKIYEEFLSNINFAGSIFICRKSETFQSLWGNKETRERIKKKAAAYIKMIENPLYILADEVDSTLILFTRNKNNPDLKTITLEKMIEFRRDFLEYCAAPKSKPKSLKEQAREFNQMVSA